MGAIEEARESRARDDAVLNAPDIIFVVAGREHRIRHPNRRDNRMMFGQVAEIQTLCQKPEKRVSAVMMALNFLEDWCPTFAPRVDEVNDALMAEMREGKNQIAVEIVRAFNEIAKAVVRPFVKAATKIETAIPSPESTNG